MNALRYVKNIADTKWFTALFIVLGMSACSKAEKPTDPQPGQEFAFTFDARGEVIGKDSKGAPVGEQCSADPKAQNVCPFFRQGHKIQLEQASNIFIARYSGSPQCIAIIVNGRWYVIPNAAYCNQ